MRADSGPPPPVVPDYAAAPDFASSPGVRRVRPAARAVAAAGAAGRSRPRRRARSTSRPRPRRSRPPYRPHAGVQPGRVRGRARGPEPRWPSRGTERPSPWPATASTPVDQDGRGAVGTPARRRAGVRPRPAPAAGTRSASTPCHGRAARRRAPALRWSSACRTTSTRGSGRSSGRRPTESELAMYAIMWSEHCSYKSSKVHLRQFGEKAPPSRPDARRHRRERWRGQGLRPARGDVQGGVAQPSVLCGAPPGRGHRRRRHRPRHPGHGRPPGRGDGPAAVRRGRPRGHQAGAARRRRRHRRLRQLPRACPTSAARSSSTPATRATRWSTRSASACCRWTGCRTRRPPAPATWSS